MNAENLSPDHVIRRVAVIGTGTLGAQIAVMTAASGRDVQLYDAVPGAAEHAFLRVRSMLEGPIANGELAWDLDTVLNRMTVAPSPADAVKDVDLVIEAVREDLATKREVFAEISRHNPAALLATNSSSIPCSQLADVVGDPSRLVNLHFFTEFWHRSIVELMGNSETSAETMRIMEAFGTSLGLFCAVCHGESKGFIINRIWRAVKRESLRVVDEGHADPETVDRLWAFFWDTNRGPFGAMDQIGLDVIADIEDSYIATSPDPTDVRSRTLHELVDAGHLGEKAGRGFYGHPDPAYKRPGWPRETVSETSQPNPPSS